METTGTGFSAATAISPDGDGDFAATLSPEWTVGGKPHGGYLMALLTRAGVAAVPDVADPLAVAAHYLRPPDIGPVRLLTDVRKRGRTVNVVTVVLEQDGRSCVEAGVTTGRLPEEEPAWESLPQFAAEPPANAVTMDSKATGGVFKVGSACEVRMDPDTAGFLTGRTDVPLRLRLWARPIGEQPDPLFALIAGDINTPVTFNLGYYGWSPTVQLTALLRARPAAGWLRLQVDCKAVHGSWFDSDATVIDSRGRLICQSRQLALAALPVPELREKAGEERKG